MSPRELARVIAQSALAQLKVAVDQGLVLSVDTAEDLAIAIGGGAAQRLVFLAEESAEVAQSGADWAEDTERLSNRRPIGR